MTQTPAPPQDIPSILRTPLDGCFTLRSNTWGTFLASTHDPDANVEISAEDFENFELHDEIHPIPAHLWERWVQLCFHFVRNNIANGVEVSCRFLRKEDDLSQWRIVIPIQEVDAASVRVKSFDHVVDIETGESIEYPPAGWIPSGSSHSHNTMQAFFSGTDDKYELTDPGLHIVVGSININQNKYTLKASIVAGGRRFDVPFDRVLQIGGEKHLYHDNVLACVTFAKQTWTSSVSNWNYGNWNYGGDWNPRQLPAQNMGSTWHGQSRALGWEEDPFYWQTDYSQASTSHTQQGKPIQSSKQVLDALDQILDMLPWVEDLKLLCEIRDLASDIESSADSQLDVMAVDPLITADADLPSEEEWVAANQAHQQDEEPIISAAL